MLVVKYIRLEANCGPSVSRICGVTSAEIVDSGLMNPSDSKKATKGRGMGKAGFWKIGF